MKHKGLKENIYSEQLKERASHILLLSTSNPVSPIMPSTFFWHSSCLFHWAWRSCSSLPHSRSCLIRRCAPSGRKGSMGLGAGRTSAPRLAFVFEPRVIEAFSLLSSGDGMSKCLRLSCAANSIGEKSSIRPPFPLRFSANLAWAWVGLACFSYASACFKV